MSPRFIGLRLDIVDLNVECKLISESTIFDIQNSKVGLFKVV